MASSRASCAPFLTALAVFLGVALMTGTYVLTDTFTNSFGQIFEESNKGTDVAVVPRDVDRQPAGSRPAGDAGRAAPEGAPGGRRRQGRRRHLLGRGFADRRGRRPDRLDAGARLRRLRAARALRGVRLSRGQAPERTRRGRHRQAVGGRRGPRHRRRDHRQRQRGGPQVPDRRHREARRRRLLRRRDGGDPAAPRGPAAGRQEGRARPDLDRRRQGRRPGRAEAARRAR